MLHFHHKSIIYFSIKMCCEGCTRFGFFQNAGMVCDVVSSSTRYGKTRRTITKKSKKHQNEYDLGDLSKMHTVDDANARLDEVEVSARVLIGGGKSNESGAPENSYNHQTTLPPKFV